MCNQYEKWHARTMCSVCPDHDIQKQTDLQASRDQSIIGLQLGSEKKKKKRRDRVCPHKEAGQFCRSTVEIVIIQHPVMASGIQSLLGDCPYLAENPAVLVLRQQIPAVPSTDLLAT